MNRKALAVLCSAALAVGGMFVATASNPTKAAVSSGPFSAWATGTAEHVGVLDTPPTRLIDAEAAFSRAATASSGLTPVNNELGQAVVPTDLESILPPQPRPTTAGFNSYGAGSGVEIGLGKTIPNNPDKNDVISGGLAEMAADPPTPAGAVTVDPATNGFVTKDLLNLNNLNPLAYANVLRGQGKANWSDNNGLDDPCGATQPLGFGLGHAADVQLINQSAIALPLPGSQPVIATDQTPQPPGNNPGAADESRSFTSLLPDPANPGHFIVHSETRQILAPVTLFKGNPTSEVNIDIGGEWVLKADADGHSPTKVTYAPDGAPTPTTPILRVFSGGKLQGQLTTQDILMNKGLNISIPQNPAPPVPPPPPILLEISAGEPAHPIGNTNAPIVPDPTGQSASGAVDVVRVKVLNSLPQVELADVRVGHMEVNAQAPAGGVSCAGPAGATTTTTAPGGGGSTTTTGPGGGGGTTTTTAPGGGGGTTTTTAPGGGGGGATTTTAGPGGGGGATTTTANPGTTPGNTTPTTAATKPNNNNNTTTTGPAQVQAVTFSQTPAATPQSQTPNFTG